MIRSIGLALLCAACGADDDKGSTAPAAEVAPTADETGPQLAIVAVKELPVCERENNGVMVYVEPTKKFMVCDGTTGEWYPVDLRGERGVDGDRGAAGPAGADGARGESGEVGMVGASGQAGEPGEQGVAGVQGPAGATGAQGPAGTDGATGPQGPAGADNTWLDPIDGKQWTLSTRPVSLVQAQAACAAPFSLPTTEQWTLATARGICNAGVACTCAWTVSGADVDVNGTACLSGDPRAICVR